MGGNKMQLAINDNLNAQELNGLFGTNNWQIDDLDKLEQSIKNAWCYITARNENGELIGYVQVISDGIMHAYILRMIVHPEYRKKGVGTKIMQELMEILKEKNMKPTLAATPGNEHFYGKFGFKTVSNGITAMCLR